MIGNDIVDLNFAGINSRWREQRFLDKLFTHDEQSAISTGDCYRTIWRLWSMKESAFKIWARNGKSSRFNPKLFNCKIISETIGTVSFDNLTVNTTTEHDTDVIYTTAYLKNIPRLIHKVDLGNFSITKKQQLLRENAIEKYSELKSVPKTSISIEKNEFGVPEFLINQKVRGNALTLTHHGQYGGFAISY